VPPMIHWPTRSPIDSWALTRPLETTRISIVLCEEVCAKCLRDRFSRFIEMLPQGRNFCRDILQSPTSIEFERGCSVCQREHD
jgi:hypothetical protein